MQERMFREREVESERERVINVEIKKEGGRDRWRKGERESEGG